MIYGSGPHTMIMAAPPPNSIINIQETRAYVTIIQLNNDLIISGDRLLRVDLKLNVRTRINIHNNQDTVQHQDKRR